MRKTFPGLFACHSLVFAIFLSISPAIGCEIGYRTIPLTIGSHSAIVELATDPDSRACGLSNRYSLPENRGMLFVFPSERPLSFWMRETILPLSIAFVDRNKRVIGIRTMKPLDSKILYQSGEPGLYALEMSMGWFVAHGVQPGDRLEFKLPEGIEIR